MNNSPVAKTIKTRGRASSHDPARLITGETLCVDGGYHI
jgi:hypothetical protein